MPDKVLVVDDEADILELARMILEEDGYSVIEASNGDEALVKAEAENPDLILLDVVMPGKSGLEVCKTLKSQAKTKNIPVVMFTVFYQEMDMKASKAAGAKGYLIKPFTPEGLLTAVNKYIEEARAKAYEFSKQ